MREAAAEEAVPIAQCEPSAGAGSNVASSVTVEVATAMQVETISSTRRAEGAEPMNQTTYGDEVERLNSSP